MNQKKNIDFNIDAKYKINIGTRMQNKFEVIKEQQIKECLKKHSIGQVVVNRIPPNINDLAMKCAIDARNSWEDFMVAGLYKQYVDLGYDRVFQISRENFKEFLEFALPKWKKHVGKSLKTRN